MAARCTWIFWRTCKSRDRIGGRACGPLCSARKTLAAICLSLPARNERGESRREGKLIECASSPRPSPPFLRREKKCGCARKANLLPHTIGLRPADISVFGKQRAQTTNSKFQTPSSKEAPNTSLPAFATASILGLGFEIWNFSGAWGFVLRVSHCDARVTRHRDEFALQARHLDPPHGESPEFLCVYWVPEPTACPPAPPRRGATPTGEFPSWEGSGVGCWRQVHGQETARSAHRKAESSGWIAARELFILSQGTSRPFARLQIPVPSPTTSPLRENHQQKERRWNNDSKQVGDGAIHGLSYFCSDHGGTGRAVTDSSGAR